MSYVIRRHDDASPWSPSPLEIPSWQPASVDMRNPDKPGEAES
jgi:hypothetical protein